MTQDSSVPLRGGGPEPHDKERVRLVEEHIYQSAVRGRQEFRTAYRRERQRAAKLDMALRDCLEAINPPDRDGISLHEWNKRLNAATEIGNAALAEQPHD